MLRSLLLVRTGLRKPETIRSFPESWQRMAAEGDIAAFLSLQDAVREARQLHASNVTWQATVERLLLRMMEERDKWQT